MTIIFNPLMHQFDLILTRAVKQYIPTKDVQGIQESKLVLVGCKDLQQLTQNNAARQLQNKG